MGDCAAPSDVRAAPVGRRLGGWYLRGDIGFSNQRVAAD